MAAPIVTAYQLEGELALEGALRVDGAWWTLGSSDLDHALLVRIAVAGRERTPDHEISLQRRALTSGGALTPGDIEALDGEQLADALGYDLHPEGDDECEGHNYKPGHSSDFPF